MRLVREAKYLEKITLRYFQPGHNQSECDNVHSMIERKIKTVDVYHPSELKLFMRSSGYTVMNLDTTDCPIYDVKGSSKNIIVNRNKYVADDGKKIKSVSWMRSKMNIIESKTLQMSETYKEADCITINVEETPTLPTQHIRSTRLLKKSQLPDMKD